MLHVGTAREPVEVVGVAPNALFDGPSHDPRPRFVFLAEQQLTESASAEPKFFVRYLGSLESVAPAVSKAVADVDGRVPIVAMGTMTSQLDTVTELERMVATLLMFFAAGSLAVAALGQYAITTFNMRRRTRDFGIRLALGASSQQVQRAVVQEAFQLTATGLLIGFALSAAAGAAFKRVLFGIAPTDPLTYTGVFTLLAAASVLASYLPAWRAGRVNVIDALRQE
jgi:ABC-type antimicrobial peptide transport system permease subunit